MTERPLIGGVELGGTKAIALIAKGSEVLDELRTPTGEPGETLGALSAWLAQRHAVAPLAAIGIGSFGPLGLDPARADFGRITTTPKPGWAGTDVLGRFRAQFALPIGFDTDVKGAALAEGRWGAAQGCRSHVYITIGTGIGGGIVIDGRPLHGTTHPEIGHLPVRRGADASFAGVCPFHGDCLEGLASGPAIAARSGQGAETLPPDHPVWASVAGELAQLIMTLILTLSPQRILIGGGVGLGAQHLLPMVRAETLRLLGGYVAGLDEKAMAAVVRPPALGKRAGPLGAVALGLAALDAVRTDHR